MRAVWPARPVGSDVADNVSDQVSPPHWQEPEYGVDAVIQSEETSTCSRG